MLCFETPHMTSRLVGGKKGDYENLLQEMKAKQALRVWESLRIKGVP